MDNNVIRLYGRQDLVKQSTLKKMYGMGSVKLEELEAHGLDRYQFGTSVFYSIKEVERKIKELSAYWKRGYIKTWTSCKE